MWRGIVVTTMMLGMAALFAGCAEHYPRLPDFTRMDNLLTRQQQDKAIKDLTNTPATDQAPAATLPEGQK